MNGLEPGTISNLNRLEPEFQNLLRGIHIRFSRFLALVLEDKKVTVPQYNVLATLAQEGGVAMNRVASKLHISKPAITHLVDRLEKERLLARRAHPQDRRISLLALTPRGKSLVQAVQKRFLSFAGETLSKVSPKDREIIKRFYAVLIAELDRILSP